MLKSENRKTIKYIMSIGSALALTLLVFYSFYPALDNDFVSWDDQFYVTLNPLITYPTLSNLKALWSVIISLNYHPLTMSTLWLNSYFSGIESASPYIITNLAIHWCNSLLVFYLLLKLFPNQYILSIFTAIVFAIHPMHVESVVWVSERKDVLYAFFFLTSLLAYIRYIDTDKRLYYLLSIMLFILSCMSKAMAVSLVPVLFIVDYVRSKDINFRMLLNKIPFIIIALIFGFIALDIQSGGNGYGLLDLVANEKALATNVSVSLWERLCYGSYSLMFYIKKFFFTL